MGELNLSSTIELTEKVRIPVLGLGVWQIPDGRETADAVTWALKCGYRHIDTAAIYGNEVSVGQAIKNSGLKREQIFITTKVWNSDHGYDKTLAAWEKSRRRLGVDYIDLYLIHWPVENQRRDTWRALETLYKEDKCRAIGVSNYTSRHLTELLDSSEIKPAINQVEFSPFLYQRDLLDFCRQQDIKVEAYSPLTRGRKLYHPVIVEIGHYLQKSPAQILIRWCLQHGLVVIPKSAQPEHIKENSQVFDFQLDAKAMDRLDGLNEQFRVAWDPSDMP